MDETAITQESPIVRVSSFVKRYKKYVAVQGVDLEIQRGEMYGLIGPDGAGKSSLMKASGRRSRLNPRLGFCLKGWG